MKNAFGQLIRLDTAEERISEPEDISIDYSKAREQRLSNKKPNILALWDNCKRYEVCVIAMPKEERKRNLKQ